MDNIKIPGVVSQLILGDCILAMNQFVSDGAKFDMILVDPPYGTTSCKWDSIIPLNEMWQCLNNLITDNGVIAIFSSEPFTSQLIMSNTKGFKYRLNWDKKIPSGMSYARYRPMQQVEDICIFTKCGVKSVYYPQMTLRDKPIKGGGMTSSESAFTKGFKPLKKTYTYKNPTTLISFAKVRKNSLHPTQKPVDLLEYLIKTYTLEGDSVLDFAMGSGSTGVACIKNERFFTGIEINKDYFFIAQDRIKQVFEDRKREYKESINDCNKTEC